MTESDPVPKPVIQATPRGIGYFLAGSAKWLTWLYCGGLLLLLAWLEWFGERSWLTGVLLFAPPQVLLLPLLVLSPWCLLFRWRMLGWHLVAVSVLGFGFMDFRWHLPPAPQAGEIKLVTHNIGQGNRQQFLDFLRREGPDVIAMQDARGQGGTFAKLFKDCHVAGVGEFLMVSRAPLVQSEIVPLPGAPTRPVAARFELLWNERTLVVYSVHLPTPRRQLSRFLSGRALVDALDETDGQPRPAQSYGNWTDARIRLAGELADVLSREKRPFLVCGDFNTPDHGVIYRTVARGLADAHREGGRGWGLTFPGSTRNPISLHGPWLRIDYAFAGTGWRPLECRPETGRGSQHCAVMARFAPKT